ncbi:MAG: tetratricopeptide repeat protein [Pseudomonadota bacterium]
MKPRSTLLSFLRLVPLVCVAALAGCASAPLQPGAPIATLFADARFAPPSEPVGADDLFTLSPAMHNYLRGAEFTAQVRSKGVERGLIDALYQKGELNLDYDASSTRNASDTFNTRSGNCLSLVIMTAAFAKALGTTVYYQSVKTDPTWSRDQSLHVASHHVNLSFLKRNHYGVGNDGDRMLTVDFLPSSDVAGYRTEPLTEGRIVAMYLNNRAAEALARKQFDLAYWWARKAVEQDPTFLAGYNTLAVVYQRHGERPLAERVFRDALVREPDNTVLMNNLMGLLVQQGRTAEAQALAQRLAVLEPVPPFHYFNKGLAAMKNKDYQSAKNLFEKEVARAPYYHEFHFWLAEAALGLGHAGAAREQLALALETSNTPGARERYSAKLEHLRANNPARPRAN